MSLPPIDLDGFDLPFKLGEYSWGPPVPLVRDNVTTFPWQDHQYHVETLALFDHDYLGVHAFVQVWDYAQQNHPDQRWQYMLLYHSPNRIFDEDGCVIGGAWAWEVQSVYEVRPFNAQVGADIDVWAEGL